MRIILLICFLIGCASQIERVLELKPGVRYLTSISEPFPIDMAIDHEALLTNPQLLDLYIKKIKSIRLDKNSFPLLTSLVPYDNGRIGLITKNIEFKYMSPPSNDEEKYQRELAEKTVDLIQLNTVIDKFGRNQNFYLKLPHKNTVAMLFELPNHPVREGSTWAVPVNMLSLNTSFIADKAERNNKVWVNSFYKDSKNNQIAEVIYLMWEKVDGKVQFNLNDADGKEFSLRAGYFAVGEFNVDKNRWEKYVGQFTNGFSTNLVALLLVEADQK